MLLAIDIGNTNVVLALLDAEDRVLEERRAPSKDGWTAEQYAAQIRALLCGRAVCGAAVSSVVPELTGVLSAAAREAAGSFPGKTISFILSILYHRKCVLSLQQSYKPAQSRIQTGNISCTFPTGRPHPASGAADGVKRTCIRGYFLL